MYECKMENIKRIKKEKEEQLIRRFYELGIPLQKVEIYLLAEIAANVFETAMVEVMTQIPRKVESPDRLFCYGESSVSGRHLVDGKWRRLTQIFTEDKILYYTDSKEEVNV